MRATARGGRATSTARSGRRATRRGCRTSSAACTRASATHRLAGSYRGTEAGACCAGPNETAACADRYTVVEGDAPCVFTCCRNATNVMRPWTSDAEGFCWEAHASEWRRLVEWRDCCESGCGDLLYLDDDEHAACMARRAERRGLPRIARRVRVPVSGEKRVVLDSPHDRAAEPRQRRNGFASGNGDELLHSDCVRGAFRVRHMGHRACVHRRRWRRQFPDVGRSYFSRRAWGVGSGAAPQGVVRRDNPAGRKRTRRRRASRRPTPAPTASTTRAARSSPGAPPWIILSMNGLRSRRTATASLTRLRGRSLDRLGPQSRHCADNHTLAGVDFVPGIGTCCTNKSSDDATCVAPAPECFHRSGPQRCGRPLEVFWQHGLRRRSTRRMPRLVAASRTPCDDLRCDPASGVALLRPRGFWRWWDLLGPAG